MSHFVIKGIRDNQATIESTTEIRNRVKGLAWITLRSGNRLDSYGWMELGKDGDGRINWEARERVGKGRNIRRER